MVTEKPLATPAQENPMNHTWYSTTIVPMSRTEAFEHFSLLVAQGNHNVAKMIRQTLNTEFLRVKDRRWTELSWNTPDTHFTLKFQYKRNIMSISGPNRARLIAYAEHGNMPRPTALHTL